jgi:aliphatic nitrilase
MGDGSGLRVVDTAAGRLGALACWEHYNPLARYALIAQHEQIHCSQFPGSLVGQIFADQMEVTIRHHALESGCFVVNATAWLSDEQIAALVPGGPLQGALRGGCFTAIVSPEGRHLATPLTDGAGMVVADLDFALIDKRKRMMDAAGHYARPELLSLFIDARPKPLLHGYLPAPSGAPSRAASAPMHGSDAETAPPRASTLTPPAQGDFDVGHRDSGPAAANGDAHRRTPVTGFAPG